MDGKLAVHRRRQVNWSRIGPGLVFTVPALVLFVVFVAYPLLSGVYYSMFRWPGYGTAEFRGVGNYGVLLHDPHFRHAVLVTVVYTIGATVLQTIVPMLIAVVLTKGFKGSILFRTMIFIPTTISLTITGLLWRLAFAETGGLVNKTVMALGLDGLNRPWLADSKAVLPIILLVSLWQSMGYYMLIYYAGLQGLDPSIYESAKVDGANSWQLLWRITVPLLKPVTVVVVTLNLLNGVKIYDLIYALTMGGPKRASESLAIYLYSLAFGSENGGRPAFGYADAIGVFLMIVAGTLFAVMARMRKRALDM